MAIFRLHKKEWEKGVRPIVTPNANTSKKRKRSSEKGKERTDADDGDSSSSSEDQANSSTQVSKPKQDKISKLRKSISSGLSTIIKRRGLNDMVVNKIIGSRGEKSKSTTVTKRQGGKDKPRKVWWTELPNSGATGAKGSYAT
jgi:RNA exonuclease 4